MSNRLLKVKTFRQGPSWSFRVINGASSTLATRRGFATENFARQAGWAAADALAPVAAAIRLTHDLPPQPRPRVKAVNPSFWRSLFG